MKRTLLIAMMTGLCTLALTASCDDSNKKKIAEQQATIDSLQRRQKPRLPRQRKKSLTLPS